MSIPDSCSQQFTIYGPPANSGMCAPKPKRRKATPEKLVKQAIVKAFRLRYQVALVHVDSGAAGMRQGLDKGQGGYSATPDGFPDLVGVLPPLGRAVYIEVKAKGKLPTLLQSRFLELLRLKGAIAFYADSVDSALSQFELAVASRMPVEPSHAPLGSGSGPEYQEHHQTPQEPQQ